MEFDGGLRAVSHCPRLELVTGVCQLPSRDRSTWLVKGKEELEGMTAEGYMNLEQVLGLSLGQGTM